MFWFDNLLKIGGHLVVHYLYLANKKMTLVIFCKSDSIDFGKISFFQSIDVKHFIFDLESLV